MSSAAFGAIGIRIAIVAVSLSVFVAKSAAAEPLVCTVQAVYMQDARDPRSTLVVRPAGKATDAASRFTLDTETGELRGDALPAGRYAMQHSGLPSSDLLAFVSPLPAPLGTLMLETRRPQAEFAAFRYTSARTTVVGVCRIAVVIVTPDSAPRTAAR